MGLSMLIGAGLWTEIAMILHFAPHASKIKKVRLSKCCLQIYRVAMK
jgi:hypothetical protein